MLGFRVFLGWVFLSRGKSQRFPLVCVLRGGKRTKKVLVLATGLNHSFVLCDHYGEHRRKEALVLALGPNPLIVL